MKLKTTYQGSNDPFEGDIELLLRSLPEGALVTHATITLAPVMKEGCKPFEELIAIPSQDQPGDWGVTKFKTADYSEVDFHARRTLFRAKGANIAGTGLQVDMGGIYVNVADDGILKENSQWVIKLSDGWGELAGLTVSKFKLWAPGKKPDITEIVIRSAPSNVSVRLSGMPSLWTIPGELAAARTSLDFAPVLNAFLAEAKARDGMYTLPFIIHSDTIARLDVTVSIDYQIRLPVLPAIIPNVKLKYGYSGLGDLEVGLMTVSLPRGAVPAEGTAVTLKGTFEASRVAFGEMGDLGDETWIAICSEQSLAQPLVLKSDLKGTSIDLHLLAEGEPASLNLAVQEDADGKPSGRVLATADIQVEESGPEDSSWLNTALPAAFRFLKDRNYWLVLQSLSGSAKCEAIGIELSHAALQYSNDGGFSWRMAESSEELKNLRVLFKLRNSPEKFKMPVMLQMGTGAGAGSEPYCIDFHRFSPLGRVEFQVEFGDDLKKYLSSRHFDLPSYSKELIVNGSFQDPPRYDYDGRDQNSWCSRNDFSVWQTSGNVLRRHHDSNLMAVLVSPLSILEDFNLELPEADLFSEEIKGPATLSQEVVVMEGCAYSLSFQYATSNRIPKYRGTSPGSIIMPIPSILNLNLPSWEVRWLDVDGRIIEKTPEENLPSTGYGSLQGYERILIAPSNSTRAQIMFMQKNPGILRLESVSFVHKSEMINSSANAIAAASQNISVIPKERFILSCNYRQIRGGEDRAGQMPEDSQKAKLELQWANKDNKTIQTDTMYMSLREFPKHAWLVTAPGQAVYVKVRLDDLGISQSLKANEVSLKRSDMISIPFIFLSEAPGELEISDMHIIYDPPADS